MRWSFVFAGPKRLEVQKKSQIEIDSIKKGVKRKGGVAAGV